jgi:hypothetical protein
MAAPSEQEYITRIRQLEELNKTLAAQVDRMRPVVDVAIEWADAEDGSKDEESAGAALVWEVSNYERQMAQPAKESGYGNTF